MPSLLKNLVSEEENLYLEFKQKWYWDYGNGSEREWGEFLKDFVALVNCSEQYVSENKYLIIGIDESSSELNSRLKHIDISHIYPEINLLREEILRKLAIYFRSEDNMTYTYNNFNIDYETINHKQILLFKIKPTKSLIILKKDLQDKNRTEKINNVFVRSLKNGKEPEVVNASPEIIGKLSKAIISNKIILEKEERIQKSIEKSIELFVQKNNMLSLGNPVKERIWRINKKAVNILFEFYPVRSEFFNLDFIYLFNQSNLTQTYEYLINQKIIPRDKKQITRFVLVDSDQKRDHKGIKIKYQADKVFTLEEFALEHLYKDYLDGSIYHDGSFRKQIPNFIKPFTKSSEDKNALIILSEWFHKISKPLMVVTGYGGVGKTTLVRYFLDDLYIQNRSNLKILFINSKEIIDEISRKGEINNVYDFYEALTKKRALKKIFNRELLELSIDNGNLLLVLDGIDEVITKLGSKFDVSNFIETIYKNYSMGNQKTKIIITCRDYFWNSNHIETFDINTLELKPFNNELAKEFFLKEFDENSSEFKKCMQLAEEFVLNEDKEKLYIPYILDVIIDMIKQNKQLGKINREDVNSNILFNKTTNDYFVGRICNREITKLSNLSIDMQLYFFMNMAVKFNGNVHYNSIHLLFDGASEPSKELIEKFKGHPLLLCSNSFLSFRYDFFSEYFINLKISDFFNKHIISEFSNDLKAIINKYIHYDNSFTELMCERLIFSDELKLFVIDLIESIIKEMKLNESLFLRKLISSLVVVLLTKLKQSNQKLDIELRTSLIEDIFGENHEFLSLINIFGKENNNYYPTFNFKNKTVVNGWFENYPCFWECKTDENTKFKNTTFKDLKPRVGIKPQIFDNMFFDCDTLGIQEILNKQKNDEYIINQKNIDKVKYIFKLFEQGGNFKEQKIERIRSKCDTNTLDILINNRVITPYVNPKKPKMKQYKVSDDYFNIIKILHQNGTCVELEKILIMIL